MSSKLNRPSYSPLIGSVDRLAHDGVLPDVAVDQALVKADHGRKWRHESILVDRDVRREQSVSGLWYEEVSRYPAAGWFTWDVAVAG